MATGYYFWKAPEKGMPETTSGGCGVTVIPGFRQWVLLHPVRGEPPEGAIPVEDVVGFLNSLKDGKA